MHAPPKYHTTMTVCRRSVHSRGTTLMPSTIGRRALLAAGLASTIPAGAAAQSDSGECSAETSTDGGRLSLRDIYTSVENRRLSDDRVIGSTTQGNFEGYFSIPLSDDAYAGFEALAPRNYLTVYPNRRGAIRFPLLEGYGDFGPITFMRPQFLVPDSGWMENGVVQHFLAREASLTLGSITMALSRQSYSQTPNSHFNSQFEPSDAPWRVRSSEQHQYYLSLLRNWRDAQTRGQVAAITARTARTNQEVRFSLPPAPGDFLSSANNWLTRIRRSRDPRQCTSG